jgi:hypothetical protein
VLSADLLMTVVDVLRSYVMITVSCWLLEN